MLNKYSITRQNGLNSIAILIEKREMNLWWDKRQHFRMRWSFRFVDAIALNKCWRFLYAQILVCPRIHRCCVRCVAYTICMKVCLRTSYWTTFRCLAFGDPNVVVKQQKKRTCEYPHAKCNMCVGLARSLSPFLSLLLFASSVSNLDTCECDDSSAATATTTTHGKIQTDCESCILITTDVYVKCKIELKAKWFLFLLWHLSAGVGARTHTHRMNSIFSILSFVWLGRKKVLSNGEQVNAESVRIQYSRWMIWARFLLVLMLNGCTPALYCSSCNAFSVFMGLGTLCLYLYLSHWTCTVRNVCPSHHCVSVALSRCNGNWRTRAKNTTATSTLYAKRIEFIVSNERKTYTLIALSHTHTSTIISHLLSFSCSHTDEHCCVLYGFVHKAVYVQLLS